MVGLRLTVLGGFEARLASGAPLSLPMKKAQALLAYLGIPPAQRHSRDKLAALLWGEKSDEHARGDLRHALVVLRRALAGVNPPPLEVEGNTLALNPGSVEVDAVTFERRVAEGTPSALEHAAELYRGDLLTGFHVNEPLFVEWLVAERERLRELALEALARLLAQQIRTAATERAIQTAVRLLALDSLQEAAHRALMRLYARQGRRAAALKQYQRCVNALRRELGTEPEAETRRLYQQLLRRPVGRFEARRHHEAPGRGDGGPAAPDLAATETPLFGRQAELGRLRRLLDEAIRGRGHVATVVGEAGIGKTRLISALADEALSRGCRVLIGRCHESDSILPFGPWVDACRSGTLSADEELLDSLHLTRRAELARLLPEAGGAGLPPASDSALPLFESVVQLLEQVAVRQPLMIVLEDVHWGDEMSLRLLAFVGRRIGAWKALLIATARVEELADAPMARQILEELSRLPDSTSIALSPLSRPDTTALVRALARLGSDTARVIHVEEQIWTMSEGNPFVAVEAMRALERESARDGAGDVARRLDLPERVRDLVSRRLDRLSLRARQVAAVAAVIGRRFDFALLQSASGVGEPEAAEAVEEMVRHSVLHAVGNQVDFTHDRVRDVAYDRLLPLRRRLLHRAVAEALEAAGARTGSAMQTSDGDRVNEEIERLAYHALRGDLGERAVHYLRQAAGKAVRRSALHDSLAWFEQALAVLEGLPETRSTMEQAFEIRLEMRPVLHQLGDVRRRLEGLREAQTLAERLNDDHRRGRVLASLANVHSQLGELDEALVTGTCALEIAGRLGDLRLRVLTTAHLEIVHCYRGEYQWAVELATDNLAAGPPDMMHEYFEVGAPPAVWDRSWLVMNLAQLGRLAEAHQYEDEAIRLAEPTRQAFTIGLAHYAAGTLRLLEGDWAATCSLLERGIAVARTANIPLLLSYLVPSSTWALAQLGESREVLDRLREGEELVDRASARGIVAHLSWAYHLLGRAALVLDRPEKARRLGHRAVECAPRHPGLLAHALQLLGDVATHPDRFDGERAEGHYQEALTLAEPRGMRPLVAHCHLGLGRLYRVRGKRPQTQEHFSTAMTMYREMDMRFWLKQVETEAGG